MSTHSEQSGADHHLSDAHSALACGAWDAARTWFAEALEREESPEALEGFAVAAWWQNDAAALPARERAYRLYQERGDRRGAARVAAFHAIDYCSLRDEPAVANGWIQRARRLLEGLVPCPEQAMVDLWEGHIVLSVRNDTAQARELSARAATLARSLGAVDWEMLALALEGLALVIEGEIAAGMRCLDEAATAAVAGDMQDLDAIGTVCCYLIYACERVRDYDRAAQWCDLVRNISTRWSDRLAFSLCRTHYAGVLIWRGAWSEAETELTNVIDELTAIHPVLATEGVARLAELRRRQGRPDEAAGLFRRVESQPRRRQANCYALLGRAELALDQADAATAADLAERFLRGPGADDPIERVTGLEVLVRAQLALPRPDRAAAALTELQAVGATVPLAPVRALAEAAAGQLAVTTGDLEGARRAFEDAVDLFDRAVAPYEAAWGRLHLGRVLASLDRTAAAEQEVRAALECFRRIGAARAAESAAGFLRELANAMRGESPASGGPARLTPREVQVLGLIAAGRSNQEIATELVLSVRTVERHISTIYEKLGADGKVARATATAYALRHGLTSPQAS